MDEELQNSWDLTPTTCRLRCHSNCAEWLRLNMSILWLDNTLDSLETALAQPVDRLFADQRMTIYRSTHKKISMIHLPNVSMILYHRINEQNSCCRLARGGSSPTRSYIGSGMSIGFWTHTAKGGELVGYLGRTFGALGSCAPKTWTRGFMFSSWLAQ
jgi:hypothetical protein